MSSWQRVIWHVLPCRALAERANHESGKLETCLHGQGCSLFVLVWMISEVFSTQLGSMPSPCGDALSTSSRLTFPPIDLLCLNFQNFSTPPPSPKLIKICARILKWQNKLKSIRLLDRGIVQTVNCKTLKFSWSIPNMASL